jgi:hypothetical protein
MWYCHYPLSVDSGAFWWDLILKIYWLKSLLLEIGVLGFTFLPKLIGLNGLQD